MKSVLAYCLENSNLKTIINFGVALIFALLLFWQNCRVIEHNTAAINTMSMAVSSMTSNIAMLTQENNNTLNRQDQTLTRINETMIKLSTQLEGMRK